eukprot:TRINITY_DN29582_c0_g1_i1.p1 TRINITY_DN29582_c0_g1~~TRINITY_DN29582_c0_g1_i1.p1  ORF type:complete len:160 (+),score=2.45 TRINITY_DN29582_c0_g1_i1:272-751(+)
MAGDFPDVASLGRMVDHANLSVFTPLTKRGKKPANDANGNDAPKKPDTPAPSASARKKHARDEAQDDSEPATKKARTDAQVACPYCGEPKTESGGALTKHVKNQHPERYQAYQDQRGGRSTSACRTTAMLALPRSTAMPSWRATFPTLPRLDAWSTTLT